MTDDQKNKHVESYFEEIAFFYDSITIIYFHLQHVVWAEKQIYKEHFSLVVFIFFFPITCHFSGVYVCVWTFFDVESVRECEKDRRTTRIFSSMYTRVEPK